MSTDADAMASASMNPTAETVEAGYDALASRYLTWAARIHGEPTPRFLGEFLDRLPLRARVLDLGCGAGVPVAKALAPRCALVGVDISDAQVQLARRNVPAATFIHRDMADLYFEPASWNGIVALASITHLPREHHQQFLRRLARWLVPGGLLLTSLGAVDAPGAIAPWLEVPMFYASYDTDTNRRLVRSVGLEIVVDEVAELTSPSGQEGTELWLLAQKRL